MHHARARRMAGRKLKSAEDERPLVEYADQEPSAFSSMLGGLIEANVKGRVEKQGDFQNLVARVGIFVTDTDADTVMALSNLKIGPLGMPIYVDEVGRGVAMKLLRGSLKIEGLLPNLLTLNAVTRIFSVAGQAR